MTGADWLVAIGVATCIAIFAFVAFTITAGLL